MLKQIIPLVLGTILVVAGMLYQGQKTERWTAVNSELLERFAERVDTVPKSFSGWTSEETPLTDEEFARTGCKEYVSRIYNKAGKQVSVYMVVGTARNITIHSPTWCYQGAGYEMESDETPFAVTVGDKTHEFTTSTFRKEDQLGTKRLRIFWSYTDDGSWIAPSLAKGYFAGKTALWKIYLITNISPEDNDVEGSASIDFAKEFLPIINQGLFPPELKQATAPSDASGTSAAGDGGASDLDGL